MNLITDILTAIGALVVGAIGAALVGVGILIAADYLRRHRYVRREQETRNRIATRFQNSEQGKHFDVWTTRN